MCHPKLWGSESLQLALMDGKVWELLCCRQVITEQRKDNPPCAVHPEGPFGRRVWGQCGLWG